MVFTRRVHEVTQHRSGTPGVEALTLFSNHSFPRHSHEQFGIGIMTAGTQRSWSLVGHVESQAGDVIMVNPGEMHDGMPAGDAARGWRILYFDPALVHRHIEVDTAGREMVIRPVVRDAELATQVARLFAEIEKTVPDTLAIEEHLLCCLMLVWHKHQVSGQRAAAVSPSVAKAIERLDDAPEVPASLAELAALSDVSRFQLLRGFAKEVGITPRAYLIQRRVRLVRRLLADGLPPAEAALRAGFADQSHMTRAFVRQFGITPARYKGTR